MMETMKCVIVQFRLDCSGPKFRRFLRHNTCSDRISFWRFSPYSRKAPDRLHAQLVRGLSAFPSRSKSISVERSAHPYTLCSLVANLNVASPCPLHVRDTDLRVTTPKTADEFPDFICIPVEVLLEATD
jgi:hypothetical protein